MPADTPPPLVAFLTAKLQEAKHKHEKEISFVPALTVLHWLRARALGLGGDRQFGSLSSEVAARLALEFSDACNVACGHDPSLAETLARGRELFDERLRQRAGGQDTAWDQATEKIVGAVLNEEIRNYRRSLQKRRDSNDPDLRHLSFRLTAASSVVGVSREDLVDWDHFQGLKELRFNWNA